MKNKFKIPMLFVCAQCAAVSSGSAHDHYAAGILDVNGNRLPDAGEPLRLVGPSLEGREFRLLPRPAGFRPVQRCGGYYMLDESARTLFPNDAFTFTALSDGTEESGDVDHAMTGAYLWVEVLEVKGPAGGRFGFWDVGRSANEDTPTVEFLTGSPTGNFAFVISGGVDAAGEDPHGHLHGRAWTADRAGTYDVTFRFVDRSTNRPGGQPWHLPSEPFTFRFQAGPDFQPIGARTGDGRFQLTWKSQMGIWEPFQSGVVFRVLRNEGLSSDGWKQIGSVTGTSAATASFVDPTPLPGGAFYRLEYDWAETSPES